MKLSYYLQVHGLTGAARLLKKSVSTIQRWRDSGKTYIIKQDESGIFYAWERK